MSAFSFEIKHKSTKSKARRGALTTPHGVIQTPAFVTVGTKSSVKSLTPEDLDNIGTQFCFVNTYHTVLSPGTEIMEKVGGVHNFSKIKQPIITDSGGFQVFSLARNKFAKDKESPHLVKITEDGVKFKSHIDGTEFYFTPEFSIQAQKKIGADFIVAFDECTYLEATEKYTRNAMNRTHEWANRSLRAFGTSETQQMYGVIQGGTFENLRKESAKYIASLPFQNLAIGGVSVGETKKQMREQISWVMDEIWEDPRPRHLLGIGDFDDIFDSVEQGLDTLDCVSPTRHARVGRLYVRNNNIFSGIDIFDSKYRADLTPIYDHCDCYTCKNFTKAYLFHLFKQKELLYYRLATIHNLTFMETMMRDIRKSIEEDRFEEFKNSCILP
jgi:tRNA-guanine transglycosylase